MHSARNPGVAEMDGISDWPDWLVLLFPPTLAGIIITPKNGERELDSYHLQKSPPRIAKYKKQRPPSQPAGKFAQASAAPYRFRY
jgi:hypothetical protein